MLAELEARQREEQARSMEADANTLRRMKAKQVKIGKNMQLHFSIIHGQVATRALEMAKEAEAKQRVNRERSHHVMDQFIIKVLFLSTI